MIKWIESKLRSNELDQSRSRVLDLGCGNGVFLFQLSKLNFSNLNGIDYSSNSIKFANLILERDYSQYRSSIRFRQLNILEPIEQQIEDHESLKEFNLVFDKGTYRADTTIEFAHHHPSTKTVFV